MRAVSTVGGGVMFIPDEIERKTNKATSVSYNDLQQKEKKKPARRFSLFGRRPKTDKPERKAA